MEKKQKIDFILHENADEALIFRFRPRCSKCHGYGDKKPTNWDEVYKVYYSYSIIRRNKYLNREAIVFDCVFDECSVINEVSKRIKLILQGKKTLIENHKGDEYIINLLNEEIYPAGDGVTWMIKESGLPDIYCFILWNYNNQGYRFLLNKYKMKKFGEYLSKCCEYMLTHSEPA